MAAADPSSAVPSDHGLAPATSLWALKPWWCQPWSILATGLAVSGGSWWGLHRWWITLPLSLLVLAWWLVFLVLVPAAWRLEQAAAVEHEASQQAAAAADQPARPPPDQR